MEMCKVAAFYEGGIPYPYLETLPIDEFFEIIENTNIIDKKRTAEMKRGQRGK